MLLALLARCSDPPARPPQEPKQAATPSPAPLAPRPTPVEAKPRLIEEKGDLIEFIYGWPAEAASIPKLAARLEAEMAGKRKDALAEAADDKAARPPGSEFNGHYYSKVWSLEGAAGRLLSFAASIETFSGGAHGNQAQDAILWDREADAPIELRSLFRDGGAAYGEMAKPYCRALDEERAERRQEKLPLQGEGSFVDCPALPTQVVVPTDDDKDGRFDRFRVLIPPYEAGPYAEGSYVVEVSLTARLRDLIKPEYAGAFAAPASAQPQ